ncbi:MAG: relaxase/mobilization nuclease domain-containing protein [Desulfovibrio sp.]|jgi:hypothetical protein|nr:relaxase/mobilization nuclease domain-containing protein [Desulfovibrio sp.]
MKVFPHGQGGGGKPTRYLVRLDYPGRAEKPPEILRGNPDMARALVDSIDRRWKFTAGVLSWHPDDKVTPEQEERVMDDFEKVAFAGMDADQRYILWVRHSHAGHHELHFLIPRLELSSGKDFNACPPGWRKDFDVFRDLHNRCEGWARPDDPFRARLYKPEHTELHRARLLRRGRTPSGDERAEAREAVHSYLKQKVELGIARDRKDILYCLTQAGLKISRAGKEYITVNDPGSGEKFRLRGGMYAERWTAGSAANDNMEEEPEPQVAVARLRKELARVIEKRALCNIKRYPRKDFDIEPEHRLTLPDKQEVLSHDRNGTDARRDLVASGAGHGRQRDRTLPQAVRDGGHLGRSPDGTTDIAGAIERCARYVRELAAALVELEKTARSCVERQPRSQGMNM